MSNIAREVSEKAFSEVQDRFIGINNPSLYILQTHLFAENLLEGIIEMTLPKTKKLLNETRLSFIHKVRLVEAFDVIDGNIISSLVSLNKVRNDLAHKFEHIFNENDVERIGKPLGTAYLKIRDENRESLEGCLINTCLYILGFLFGYVKGQKLADNIKD